MIQDEYDVIVAGGGTAGIAAAIAAGRRNVKTLLVEKDGHLGGTSVMGIPLLGVFDGNGVQAAKGLLEEIVQRLIDEGGSAGHVHGARWSNAGHMNGDAFSLTPFDSEVFKYVAQEMVLEAKADILLHSYLTGVVREGSTVTGVELFNKSGKSSVAASVVIDATGDADVCAFAGAEMMKKDHLQNSSILFVLNDVDIERMLRALKDGDHMSGWGWWHSRLATAKKIDSERETPVHMAGHFKPWDDENIEVTFTAVSVREGEIYLNATRTVNVDATDAESLTWGEITERRNVRNLVSALRKRVPGFEKAYVVRTSPLGIRESRTVVGDYVLTGQDVFSGRDFPDGVVRGAYPSDIHDPRGGRTQFTFIEKGSTYGIPYRCFLPKGFEGLLVAGRALSSTQEANGSVRLQGTVLAQGQAAGTAAAQAVRHKRTPRAIDVDELRKTLIAQGAVV